MLAPVADLFEILAGWVNDFRQLWSARFDKLAQRIEARR